MSNTVPFLLQDGFVTEFYVYVDGYISKRVILSYRLANMLAREELML
jgi:hypothetical protein